MRSCAGRWPRGLERRQLEGLKHLGMDEKSFKRGQSYITLLTDLEESRVLDVVAERTQEAAEKVVGDAEPGAKADGGSGGDGHVGALYPDEQKRCPMPMWCMTTFMSARI